MLRKLLNFSRAKINYKEKELIKSKALFQTLIMVFFFTDKGLAYKLPDDLASEFSNTLNSEIEHPIHLKISQEEWQKISSLKIPQSVFDRVKTELKTEVSKLTNHFECSQVRLKWAEYMRWNRDAFETAYKNYQDTLDKAQDEAFKNNRYKIYLGGALAFIPISWGVSHALIFLPATWSTLLGGSIVYFFRGEVFVQRFKDKSRKLFGSLKHISEEVYQEKKLSNDTHDFEGQQIILEEMQNISLFFDNEMFLNSLKLIKYLINNYASRLSLTSRCSEM